MMGLGYWLYQNGSYITSIAYGTTWHVMVG